MVRILGLLAVVGGAGVLLATFTLQEGADAHPGGAKAAKNVQQGIVAPASAQPGIRVVHAGQVPPRAGEDKPGAPNVAAQRAPVAAAPVTTERNFLTRVGTAQSLSPPAAPEQVSGLLASRGERDKPSGKALVDRAPPMPASVDAKAREPVAPLRGSSAALASSGESTASRAKAGEGAGLRLDLNTASVQELDRLSGGGLIGKAIVRGRPYGSSDDLVRKRIVSRVTFDRIRTQVAVR